MKFLNLYLVILLFSAFFLFSVKCDIGTTYDSGEYEAAAASFHSSGKLVGSKGAPYTDWPPLYPITLSVFGNYIHGFAVVVNLLCLLFSIILWIGMAQNYLKEYLIFYGILLSLSTPLLLISSFLWSESLFLLLLSVYMHLLFQYCKTQSIKWLLWATLAGFFMLLTRTVGITLVGGVVIAFAISYKNFDKKTIGAMLIHFLVASSGLLCWLAYTGIFFKKGNIISDLLFYTSIYKNVLTFARELSSWFIPNLQNATLSLIITTAVAIITIMAYRPGDFFIKILVGMGAAYCSMFIFLSVNDSDMSRYMAVLYPAIMLLLVSVLKKLISTRPSWKKPLYIVLILWLSYPLIRISHNALRFHQNNCSTPSSGLIKF